MDSCVSECEMNVRMTCVAQICLRLLYRKHCAYLSRGIILTCCGCGNVNIDREVGPQVVREMSEACIIASSTVSEIDNCEALFREISAIESRIELKRCPVLEPRGIDSQATARGEVVDRGAGT